MTKRGRDLAEKFLPAFEELINRHFDPNEENFQWYAVTFFGMMKGMRISLQDMAEIIAASSDPAFTTTTGRSDEYGRVGISRGKTGEECLRVLLAGAIVREMFEVVKERQAVLA